MAHSELVQSVLRSLDILELVAASEEGLALRELSERLGLKAPTAHNLARTLASRGFLQKTTRPVRYRLGRAVVELGHLPSQQALLGRAPRALRRLFGELEGATVTLNQALGGEILTVLRISPERPGVLERPRGRTMHPYGTASAVLYQALWTEEERAAYRRRYPFWEYGAHLWADQRRLEQALDEARRKGYAAFDLPQAGAFPAAAPVFADNHELLAAVGASLPGEKLSPQRRRRLIQRVVAAAGRLSERRNRC